MDTQELQRKIDDFVDYKGIVERPLPNVRTPDSQSAQGYGDRALDEFGQEVLNAARVNGLSWLLSDDILDQIGKENDTRLEDLAIVINPAKYPTLAVSARRLGSSSGVIDKDLLNTALKILKHGAIIAGGINPLDLLDAEETEEGLIVPVMKFLDDRLNKGDKSNPCIKLAAKDATDAVIDSEGNVKTVPLRALQEQAEMDQKLSLIIEAFKALLNPTIDFINQKILAKIGKGPIKWPVGWTIEGLNRLKTKADHAQQALPMPEPDSRERGIPLRVTGPWAESYPGNSTKTYMDGINDVKYGIVIMDESNGPPSDQDKYDGLIEHLGLHGALPDAAWVANNPADAWLLGPVPATVQTIASDVKHKRYPILVGSLDGADAYDTSIAPCLEAATKIADAASSWATNTLNNADSNNNTAAAVLRTANLEGMNNLQEELGFRAASALPKEDDIGNEIMNRLSNRGSPWARRGAASINSRSMEVATTAFSSLPSRKHTFVAPETRLVCR